MSNSDFENLEPQQYKKLLWEDDVPINDLRASSLKRAFYLIIMLVTVMLILANTLKFPDQLEFDFVLKSRESEAIYKFPFSVFLLEDYVNYDDSVQIGDTLVQISSPEIVTLIQNEKESKDEVEHYRAYRSLLYNNEIDIWKRKIENNLTQIVSYKQKVELLSQSWESEENRLTKEARVAQQRHSAYSNLYKDSVVSKFDFLEKENASIIKEDYLNQGVIGFEQEKLNIETLIEQLKMDNLNAYKQISKLNTKKLADSANVIANYRNAQNEIQNHFGEYSIGMGSLFLRAGIEGKISYLFEGEKEVKEGTTLIKVGSKSIPSIAFVKCPPSQIGKLKEGAKCRLKVSSFPFYEWGSIYGEIEKLSATADENGNFNVVISLIEYGKMKELVAPGFTGTVNIIIEERTIAQYFFRNIKEEVSRVWN